MNKKNQLIRDKISNGKKICLPSSDEVRIGFQKRSTNKEILKYNGKSYNDEIYGEPIIFSSIEYATVCGNWTIELSNDEYGYYLKLSPFEYSATEQFISFNFPTQTDRIKFLNELNAQGIIEQISNGFNAESVIDMEYKKKVSIFKIISGIALAGLAIVGIHKYLSKSTD